MNLNPSYKTAKVNFKSNIKKDLDFKYHKKNKEKFAPMNERHKLS